MARLARIIAVDAPHHVTQRGNARPLILDSDSDRAVYLDPLFQYSRLHRLSLAGYCLMSNHVNLIAVPGCPLGRARLLAAHSQTRTQPLRRLF